MKPELAVNVYGQLHYADAHLKPAYHSRQFQYSHSVILIPFQPHPNIPIKNDELASGLSQHHYFHLFFLIKQVIWAVTQVSSLAVYPVFPGLVPLLRPSFQTATLSSLRLLQGHITSSLFPDQGQRLAPNAPPRLPVDHIFRPYFIR